jgi:hypothetical protein
VKCLTTVSSRSHVDRILIAGSMAVTILIGTWCHARWRHADRLRESAAEALAAADRDLAEIASLRARRESSGVHAQPAQDLIARVNSVLADAHLPLESFRGQSPESDSPLPEVGPSARRQSVRVNFKGWTPVQLGEFLSRWERDQPLWRPVRLELTHAREHADQSRYDIRLTLSAVYTVTAELTDQRL